MKDAVFADGLDMWVWYDKPYWYNPAEGLHLEQNTPLKQRIDAGRFLDTDADLIKQCRSYVLKYRIADLFTAVADSVLDDIQRLSDDICWDYVGYHDPVTGDTVTLDQIWDLWDGFEQKDYREPIADYIACLDPLTMQYQAPDSDQIPIRYKREPNVVESDPTFLLAEHNKYVPNDWTAHLIEVLGERYEQLVPSKVWRTLNENQK